MRAVLYLMLTPLWLGPTVDDPPQETASRTERQEPRSPVAVSSESPPQENAPAPRALDATRSRAAQDSTRDPRHSEAVKAANLAYAQAMAVPDPTLRHTRLAAADRLLSQQLTECKDDAETTIKLLKLRAIIQVRQADHDSARATVKRLHSEMRKRFGPAGFDSVLNEHVRRLRNKRLFHLAILHLEESLRDQDRSTLAAQRLLLIGNLLLAKAYPDGPYDQAARHYASVSQHYRELVPQIAEDARLRQAKALWRNQQEEEARRLLIELRDTANSAVAEQAEHYLILMSSDQ